MKRETAKKLIQKTKADYNKISAQFSSTRKKGIWPDNLESFELMKLKKGKSILDIGSGSGRLYPYLTEAGLEYTGIDLSEELVKYSKAEHPKGKFIIGDATDLPFTSNEFDYVTSVAVFYHIPSKELRKQALNEAYRVLKEGGEFYISVWYFWNKKKTFLKIYTTYASTLWRRIFNAFSTSSNDKLTLDFGDFFLDWKSGKGETQTERYCHAWTIWGLKRALKKAGFSDLKVIKGYKSGTRNINIICKK